MKTLLVLNDAPYGSERTYNGLRLAETLAKRENEMIHLFLLGDAVLCAKSGHRVPQGYYSIQNMLEITIRHCAEVGICGICMDSRGITDPELIHGAQRSTMAMLADWTIWADKVLVF